MQVRDFMTTHIYTLEPEDTIETAAAMFVNKGIDGVPVLRAGRLVGLFTKTHMVRAIHDGWNLNTSIDYFMNTNVRTIDPDTDILDMAVISAGRYPVVKDGEMVGFITKSDIIVALHDIIDSLSSRFETVLQSAYNPVVSVDSNGIIDLWNQAAERTTGLKADDVLYRHINDVVPESKLMDIIATGASEYGIKINVGGHPLITNRAPIVKDGKISGAVAVLYDLTELEKVSKELASVKILNKELDAIIESSFDGLYITDGDGYTLRINKAVERITGIGEDQLVGKTMNEIVDEGILSRSASLMVMEKREPVTTTLLTVKGQTLLVSASPVFDDKGNIYRIVTNVRDVSELNMLKQKIEQLEGIKEHFELQLEQMKLRLSGHLVYKNHEMENLMFQAMKVAEFDSTILISGESGAGKELVAEVIYRNSRRCRGPYVKLNCAAIPESLLESELFGYEAGAFTGAKKEGKPGLFELADDGTLLLDEVGEIPLHLQAKLLRALQEKEIMRVGGTRPIKINVRIIAATNRDLEAMVKKDEFREDLYYRLNVVPLHVPPLRERRDDIPILVTHFLNIFNKRYNLNKTLSPELFSILIDYEWPGNIRQLENLVERLIVTSDTDEIIPRHLPPNFLGLRPGENSQQAIVLNQVLPLKEAVENLEKSLLQKVLAVAKSQNEAAEILKVDPATISRKARKYGLSASL